MNFLGEDCIERFLKEILEINTYLKQFIEWDIPYLPTFIFEPKEYKYWLGEKPFLGSQATVKTHYHLTGKFRRLAHNERILNKKIKVFQLCQ